MIKIKRALLVLAMLFVLNGCASEPTKPEPLVIERVQPNHTGTAIVYGQGERESVYRGTFEIVNDGTDGEEIFIVIYAGNVPLR